MQKKKYYICVTPFFPSPTNWRGAYILDQVKAIRCNSDYEVVVFKSDTKNDEYCIEGFKVYQYKTYTLPSNIMNGLFNGVNARSFIRRIRDLGIDLSDVAFVHCHVSMHVAHGLAMKKLNPNIKVLLQHHDLDPYNLRSGVTLRNNRWNIRYRAKKAIQLYNNVDLHICISEACKACLTNFPNPREGEVYEDCLRSLNLCKGLPSITPKATYVLYNGVNTNIFHKVNGFKRKDNDLFCIGCISNFNVLKDHITLIKAVEILVNSGYKKIRLSMLGSGEMRPSCEKYIEEHGLTKYVEWVQERVHEQLPEYYHSLDLFVLPSYFEGFGCVYTEAAACGVPFMGCLNQGYSEYIPKEDRNLWLIKPKDYIQLAKNIANYIDNGNEQKYCHPLGIDELIKEYLIYIGTL